MTLKSIQRHQNLRAVFDESGYKDTCVHVAKDVGQLVAKEYLLWQRWFLGFGSVSKCD